MITRCGFFYLSSQTDKYAIIRKQIGGRSNRVVFDKNVYKILRVLWRKKNQSYASRIFVNAVHISEISVKNTNFTSKFQNIFF